MLNQVKSSFTVPSPRSEAKALVEAFARQDKKRLYPFALQNFTLGIRFQNADSQTQRVIVMAMLAWLDQHSLKSDGCQDQNTWQMVWKMREAFLHMLQVKIPFQEQDVIAMLNWSASQSSAAAYIYFSGAPQIIKVVGDYLKNNPMSDGLHEAIGQLAQSLESGSMSVEVRRWILRLKDLMGETQVSLPLVAGDGWADTALKEIYALNSRSKTAWAELLTHCAQATGSTPTRRWLAEADKYIDAIGDLYLFIKLSHWFPLVDKAQMASANAVILKGLVWLCSKSEDPAIAFALAELAISNYKKGSGTKAAKIGNACCWALGHMPIHEGMTQLAMLRDKIKDNTAQKTIQKALAVAAKQ
ncbi:MAG TPA: hypothetical protein VK897_20410 [Anaerolineales bacterium]|nr:hypothetical protein [Anaerolineales bacterium]